MRMPLFAVSNREEVRRWAAWDAATPICGSDDRQDCDGRRISWGEFATNQPVAGSSATRYRLTSVALITRRT